MKRPTPPAPTKMKLEKRFGKKNFTVLTFLFIFVGGRGGMGKCEDAL